MVVVGLCRKEGVELMENARTWRQAAEYAAEILALRPVSLGTIYIYGPMYVCLSTSLFARWSVPLSLDILFCVSVCAAYVPMMRYLSL